MEDLLKKIKENHKSAKYISNGDLIDIGDENLLILKSGSQYNLIFAGVEDSLWNEEDLLTILGDDPQYLKLLWEKYKERQGSK